MTLLDAGDRQEAILPWSTHRLWSLWDMIEINISKLIADTHYLRSLRSGLSGSEPVAEETRKIYLDACHRLEKSLEGLDVKASQRALSRLIGNLQQTRPFSRDSFGQYADDFLLRLRDELDLTKFLYIETTKVIFYESAKPIFGARVAKLYPGAYSDIEEAGKCLALGRSTACVFHLMRVMEVGVRALASGLGIPDPTKPAERNWGYILREIKTAIDGRKRWRKKGDKTFYEEAHASLDSIRNPWRNATMHVEKTYTPEDAENILYTVRFFMTKIASRIDENGKDAPEDAQLS